MLNELRRIGQLISNLSVGVDDVLLHQPEHVHHEFTAIMLNLAGTTAIGCLDVPYLLNFHVAEASRLKSMVRERIVWYEHFAEYRPLLSEKEQVWGLYRLLDARFAELLLWLENLEQQRNGGVSASDVPVNMV